MELRIRRGLSRSENAITSDPCPGLPDSATQTRRTYPREGWQIDFTVMLSPEKFQASLGVSTQVFQKDRNIKLKKIGLNCFRLPCSTWASPMAQQELACNA